ncbi:MAG: beta-lactam-binding protein with PASTA domain [Cyclobacteriaceae bacterium]|jgi:beta-lactam-binding protein with PASTA domain
MSKEKTWKDLVLHIFFVFGIAITSVFIFFYMYLPMTTNHGESLTVPDVRGVTLDELKDFLGERNLRFEVTADSGFSASQKPLAVLKQFPMPNSKVKENRKIYVTLNSEKAPLIRMPKLISGSVKNAQLILQTYDLALGEIIYVPDRDLNYVLKQQINGREVLEGEKIPKGSKIDLVAGDGLGQQNLASPNLIGHDLESAQIAIIGSGLKIGDIIHEKKNIAVIETELTDGTIETSEMKVSPGSILKQSPKNGRNMKLGQKVDLWVYTPDSLNVAPTLLD